MSGVGFAIVTPYAAKSLNPEGSNYPGNMPFKIYKILALDRNRVHMVKQFKMKPIADRKLVIPFLGIRGRLSHGERRISWSNGTEWVR